MSTFQIVILALVMFMAGVNIGIPLGRWAERRSRGDGGGSLG